MNIYGITNLIKEVALQLGQRCSDQQNAEREAWWLLEKLTGQFEAELLAVSMIILTQEQDEQLQNWISQRVHNKKPLQYILGSVPFNHLDILISPPILIPRPETEEITAWVIDLIKSNAAGKMDILDLCTGSGCIALSLAKALPEAVVTGSDINVQAVVLAEKNKKLNSIGNANFMVSDLYGQLDMQKKFDLIMSNPPYLSADSYQQVADEIRLWEDPRALIADHKGMAIYERILHDVKTYLKKPKAKTPIPQLVLEIGIDQISIKDLVLKAGFFRVELFNDMSGKPRWLAAWLLS